MTHEPSIGARVLDRYRLLSVLGRGGAGTVYAACDERLDRTVAVKRLRPQARVPRAAERMAREARALAQLRHRHLVTLLDYGVDAEGAPVMVMEHIEGRPLDQLAAHHAWTPSEVVAVLDQVLDALSICHAQGFVHRDLKPGNVLLDTACDRLSVKVIDFGIVALAADAGATALTLTGQIFGSLRYMAPEQWRQHDVGGVTDLYAVGLIGYILLTGTHFITTRAPSEILRAHLMAPRPRPSHSRSGDPVPPGLLAVLERATHPDPDARWPDAAAMQAALAPWVRPVARPAVAPPAPPPPTPAPISLDEMQSAATLVGPEWAMAQTLVDDRLAETQTGSLHDRLMNEAQRAVPTPLPLPLQSTPIAAEPTPETTAEVVETERRLPWWTWLLVAAGLGGLFGLVATRF